MTVATITRSNGTSAAKDIRKPQSARLPLSSLKAKALLRQTGINRAQVKALAELDGQWTDIVVMRDELQIVDGLHRFFAAKLLGHSSINCVFFDGSVDEAFLEALRRNIQHGLPLTLNERKSAAKHLLGLRANWSDRRISGAVGLSPSTIAKLRSTGPRLTDQNGHLDTERTGKDNRTRPRNSTEVRQRIEAELRTHPRSSLRNVAAVFGTSPETVRKVRKSINVSAPSPSEINCTNGPSQARPLVGPSTEERWLRDSSLNSSNHLREFAAWFSRTAISAEWRTYVEELPISRVYEVVDEARSRARCWKEFADECERKAASQASKRPNRGAAKQGSC